MNEIFKKGAACLEGKLLWLDERINFIKEILGGKENQKLVDILPIIDNPAQYICCSLLESQGNGKKEPIMLEVQCRFLSEKEREPAKENI